MSLYDLARHKLATLEHGFRAAGSYSKDWSDAIVGNQLKGGIYLCRIKSPLGEQTYKIVVSQ